MQSSKKLGFVYEVVVHAPDGKEELRTTAHNLMPDECVDYLNAVAFLGAEQNNQWYLGVYSGNYTPRPSDKAQTFPALATEFTAYEGTTRPAAKLLRIATGILSNLAEPVTLKTTAAGTLYGGFIAQAAAKGGTTGVLISAVRFASPIQVREGSTVTITATNQLTG